MKKKNIAIIGAGISGLILANEIKDIAKITIFEKARGVGGRMASRYNQDFNFDFGAQFFTAKNPEFILYLKKFIDDKIVENWQGKFVEIDGNKITYNRLWNDSNPHFIASPKMNSMAKYLANNLDIKLKTKITKIEINDKYLEIYNDENINCGKFDFIIITIPINQAIELIPSDFLNLAELKNKKMLPCFALMLGLKNKPKIDWDCAYLKNSKLSWIAFENSKPQRNPANCITILSRNSWAQDNLERDLNEVKSELISEFEYATNCKLDEIIFSDIHRWRYSNMEKQDTAKYYFDLKHSIALCGDWCIQGRIESAFISAMTLSSELKQKILS